VCEGYQHIGRVKKTRQGLTYSPGGFADPPYNLIDVPAKWIDRAGQHRSLDKLILDLNSSVSETYGRRERHPSAVQRR